MTTDFPHDVRETLAAFLKEEGEAAAAPAEKLVLKKKDIADKEGEILVLKQSQT